MKLLMKGARGPEVVKLQKLLNIVADGIFGPATEKAVMRYQLQKQLTVDGIVGNNTWQMLTLSKEDICRAPAGALQISGGVLQRNLLSGVNLIKTEKTLMTE